jgi:hypothetical protein
MIKRILLVVWLLLCGLVPLIVQWGAHDADEAFLLLMIVLTAPSGFLLTGFLSILFMLLHKTLGLEVPESRILDAVYWVLFVMVGYVQWFIVLPWFSKKIKRA